jgi:hypothetical protein
MKIHKIIRTNKVHDKRPNTNLNTIAFRRSWGGLLLLSPRCCRRPLCSPRVVGQVREGVAWMAIAFSDRRLEGRCR